LIKMVDGSVGGAIRLVNATISTIRPKANHYGWMVGLVGQRWVFWQPSRPSAHNAPVMDGGGSDKRIFIYACLHHHHNLVSGSIIKKVSPPLPWCASFYKRMANPANGRRQSILERLEAVPGHPINDWSRMTQRAEMALGGSVQLN
jgi:hypothetical protein